MAGSGRRIRSGLPMVDAPAPGLAPHVFPADPARDDFDNGRLPAAYQWLRSPWPEDLFSLTARPGHLRLIGRDTIGSLFRQSLVARRQQSHCYTATTKIEFEPRHFQQMAGLVCYYNSSKFHYLHVSRGDDGVKYLRVMSALPDSVTSDAFTPPIALPDGAPLHLRADVDFERLHFSYRFEGEDWRRLPEQLDASILSDEATAPGLPNFTGAFVGVACQDLSGAALPADFDYFEYLERDFSADLGGRIL